LLTVLPTPPSMRDRTRRFHEDEQVLPRGFADSRHPAKLTNRSSSRHHLRSSWPYAKVLCDSSQVSFPRSVALAQLSSPRACSPEAVICYTDLQEIPISQRGLVQCGRHPNNSMPMTGVAKMHPSCRSGVSFKQRVWHQPADAKRS
jgi:hypothetical protein